MPLTETSSLDDALARILGAPATPAAPAVNLAPATGLSYGGLDWGGLTNASTTQTGQPAAPATGGIIATQAAPAPVPAAASPAEAAAATRPAGLGEGKEWLTYADQMRADLAQSGITGEQAERHVNDFLTYGGYDETTMFDPAIHSQTAKAKEIAARPADFQTVTTTIGNPITMGTMQASTPTAGKTSRAPVNPGPKAPWQASQQYWKDLAAYNASIGK